MNIQEIDLLFNRFDFLHHKMATSQGLSDSIFKILRAILVLGEGCTQTKIYQHLNVNKQTTNSAIKQLLHKKYIYFQNGFGRESKIFLTPLGHEIIDKKIRPIENIENNVFKQLSIQDIEAFVAVANKYLDLLSTEIATNINKEGNYEKKD